MRRSVVPTYVPYVVRLYRYYESDSAIYVLLQYATGGKLWSYVRAYLNQHYEVEIDDALMEDPRPRASTGNTDKSDHTLTKSTEELATVPCEEPQIKSDEKTEEENTLGIREGSLELDDTRGSVPYLHSISNSSDQKDLTEDVFHEELTQVDKRGLEYFSINSVDSDSDPGSRLQSSASDNQVILENEEDEEVDIDLIAQQAIASHPPTQSTPVQDIYVVECPDADTPKPRPSTSSLLGEDSIYDRFRGAESSSHSSEQSSAVGSPMNGGQDSADAEKSSGSKDGQSPSRSRSCSISRPQVYRLTSQDRSFGEGDGKPRSRNLSSVFGELDLAAAGSDDEGVGRRCGPIVRLPEGCVKQWAAEIVVALSRLHCMGIVCR